jgi:hypothetical protein
MDGDSSNGKRISVFELGNRKTGYLHSNYRKQPNRIKPKK